MLPSHDLCGGAVELHVRLGSGFCKTILLQRLLDYTPAQAGFVILPGALGMAVHDAARWPSH
jgi:hypothetical protein